MKVISTKGIHADGVKMLVYGASGVGKTVLCSTAPNPIIISAEKGLLSLSGLDIPAVEVTSFKEVQEVYKATRKGEWDTICLDSISEIAEIVLAEYKGMVNDGRQAYGMLNDTINGLIRDFRDIPEKNVVFTAKELKDETGAIMVSRPSMPGKTLTNGIAYFFDEVFFMKSTKNGRMLHTLDSSTYNAKDRSGRLEKLEEANLTNVMRKISNGTTSL